MTINLFNQMNKELAPQSENAVTYAILLKLHELMNKKQI